MATACGRDGGIGLGVIVGAVAGSMTLWIRKAGLAHGDIPGAANRAADREHDSAVLTDSLLVRLSLGGRADPAAKLFPRKSFIKRYLIAFGVWNLGLGAFLPFFTPYFSRQVHLTNAADRLYLLCLPVRATGGSLRRSTSIAAIWRCTGYRADAGGRGDLARLACFRKLGYFGRIDLRVVYGISGDV